MTAEISEKRNPITEGVIWKQLLLFFFPILLSLFFQQLYNMADTMIVGRFVGKEALSAVGGSTGMLTKMIVEFFIGLTSGTTVVVAQYYGAKEEDRVSVAVHTSMVFSVVLGVGIMVIGIPLSPWMLSAMGTPQDIMDLSVFYLRIYFLGIIGNLLYNTGASILRAVGDSRRPLYILIATCFLNILLDVVLIVMFRLGVMGAALATIASQFLSSVMVLLCLMRTKDMHRVCLQKLHMNLAMLKRVVQVGFSAGLQSVMFGISNLIVQGGINSLGTDHVAAWTVHRNIDGLFWMVITAFCSAITTFTGQNYGANKPDRVRKGMRCCMMMTVGISLILSWIFYNWAVLGFGLFTDDAAVTELGISIMRYLCPYYVIYVAVEVFSGALRGVGDCWMPMILCLFGVCILRSGWILLAVPGKRTLENILFSYPLTWFITTAMFIIYYLFFSKLRIRKRIIP